MNFLSMNSSRPSKETQGHPVPLSSTQVVHQTPLNTRRFMVETKKGNGCGRSKPFGFLSFRPKKKCHVEHWKFLGGQRYQIKKKLTKCRVFCFRCFQNILKPWDSVSFRFSKLPLLGVAFHATASLKFRGHSWVSLVEIKSPKLTVWNVGISHGTCH